MLLLVFAFLAGFVTILAPCIWPVLPIVLSSSIAGEKGSSRPLGITLGVMVSFTIFTLFISTIVRIFHLDPNSLRLFAVIIIGFLGVTMIIPALAVKLEQLVNFLSNRFNQTSNHQTSSGFLPGLITGLSLGIVWTPCAGPILATVATLVATGHVSVYVFLLTFAYVTGVGIPLFAFAYGGQRFIAKARILNRFTGTIQQVFGGVMILAAIAIYTNYDQTLQLQLLNTFPQLGTIVNGFEQSPVVTQQLNRLTNQKSTVTINTAGLFNTDIMAPEFTGIDHWLNTANPITLASLKGQVVLVDFWTYTCINCIRTLPHVTSWYDKYHDQGFVVIGIHTPEFQFEHDTNNVESAIKQFSIHYPVAQDNEYATWNAYGNQYWPAEYLIDVKGIIRRVNFGEGEYDQTELAIRALLQEADRPVTGSLDTMADQTPTGQLSPETYVGSARMQYEYPDGTLTNTIHPFVLQTQIPPNTFSFGGTWHITNETAIAGNNATLNYNFIAGKVYVILRPGNTTNGKVSVSLDGAVIDSAYAGSDVQNGMITITTDRLYNIVDLHGKVENHVVKLEFLNPGIEVYTFTFG